MTALKKTVRTRRGVEPAGRPARREAERGRRATNELVQDVRAESWSAALAGCAADGDAGADVRPGLCALRAGPRRERGAEGLGSLGGRLLAGSRFLGTPATRRHAAPRGPSRRRAGDLELRAPRQKAPARTDDVLGRPSTLCSGVGLARTRRKAAKPERRIPKRGASEAEKDDEKGTSHAENGVAETGRGPANATSREPP